MDRQRLGNELRAARLAAGLTLRELAAQVGMNHQTILNIESGANTTLATLEAVAAALGVDLQVKVQGRPKVGLPVDKLAIAQRFMAVLPAIPDEDLAVLIAEIAAWEADQVAGVDEK